MYPWISSHRWSGSPSCGIPSPTGVDISPPNWAFGPAWTIILGLAAWSAVIAWNAAQGRAERTSVVILFVTNAVCHLLWSPLFFKWRRPDWALIEVAFLWLSIAALVGVTQGYCRKAAALLLPYLLWVSFASAINYATVQLNGPFG